MLDTAVQSAAAVLQDYEGAFLPVAAGQISLADAKEIPDRVVTTKDITTGKRDEGATRGEVSGSGKATSTAPADWWFTFGRGGGLSNSLAKGFKRGFKEPLRFGKARGFG